jgi:hypothetical protein
MARVNGKNQPNRMSAGTCLLSRKKCIVFRFDDFVAMTSDRLERGTFADEQFRMWRETGDIKSVIDHLVEVTMENVPCEVLTTFLPRAGDSDHSTLLQRSASQNPRASCQCREI